MANPSRRLTPDEAAAAARMDVQILWYYAEVGLIAAPSEGYSDSDLADLRRIRRLHDDLDLDHPAIEVMLRLCRRIQDLQTEIRRLELAARPTRLQFSHSEWIEADWGNEEISDKG
jgi:DNA-binding transcriptional MerR regulator